MKLGDAKGSPNQSAVAINQLATIKVYAPAREHRRISKAAAKSC
jgi:hypothetical protein